MTQLDGIKQPLQQLLYVDIANSYRHGRTAIVGHLSRSATEDQVRRRVATAVRFGGLYVRIRCEHEGRKPGSPMMVVRTRVEPMHEQSVLERRCA
jgi:hypothetical protein